MNIMMELINTVRARPIGVSGDLKRIMRGLIKSGTVRTNIMRELINTVRARPSGVSGDLKRRMRGLILNI